MRLINTRKLQLEEFNDLRQVKYAVISHRWEDGEILFEDMPNFHDCTKKGAQKVRRSCAQALNDGLDWVWIDTCCINKDSSAELSEAINSMYIWYQDAQICYAYLADVDVSMTASNPAFILSSAWFSRSWTLQELLAPKLVRFFDLSWNVIGTKDSLKHEISRETYIDIEALEGRTLSSFSLAQRMSWASTRVATRVEDTAYSLLGIFEIAMPLLYGEGTRAFLRLQEEIIKHSTDETIFSWESDPDSSAASGILAPSPSLFRTCSGMRPKHEPRGIDFSITNRGLLIQFDLLPISYNTFVALLNCVHTQTSKPELLVGIYLRKVSSSQFDRVKCGSSSCRWIGTRAEILFSRCTRIGNAYISSRTSSREPYVEMVRSPSKGITFQDTEAYRSLIYRSFISYQGSWIVDKNLIELPIDYQGAFLTFRTNEWLGPLPIGILQIGFDDDLNPVCLMAAKWYSDLSKGRIGFSKNYENMFDYQSIGWIVPKAKDGHVASFANPNELWAIKGDREKGLHFHLSLDGVATLVELKMDKIRNVSDESVGNGISETWDVKLIELPLKKVSIAEWEEVRMNSGQGPIERSETSDGGSADK